MCTKTSTKYRKKTCTKRRLQNMRNCSTNTLNHKAIASKSDAPNHQRTAFFIFKAGVSGKSFVFILKFELKVNVKQKKGAVI